MFFRSRQLQKTTFAAIFVSRRFAKHRKAVKIASLVARIQTSKLAWFNALIIAASYPRLASESHTFFGGKLPLHTAGFAIHITLVPSILSGVPT